MSDLIRREDAIRVLSQRARLLRGEYGDLGGACSGAMKIIESLPSAEPEQKKGRKFLGIVVNYPKICTYPEYEGKPYYSIKYEENGDMIAGFGTYKPEVLSQYLREYFISPAELERKKGEWIFHLDELFPEESTQECSVCHEEESIKIQNDNFCPNCGADMRGDR